MKHSIWLSQSTILKTPIRKSNSAWQCLPLQVKSCLLKLYFTDFKQRYKLVHKVMECTFEDFKWVAWVIRSRWVIAVDPSLTKDFDVPWLEITGKTFVISPWSGFYGHITAVHLRRKLIKSEKRSQKWLGISRTMVWYDESQCKQLQCWISIQARFWSRNNCIARYKPWRRITHYIWK